jgi:dihydroorotate dehydrogenase electron transfer subunit
MSEQHIVAIDQTVREGAGITTLRFQYGQDISPGQFLMVWIPGVDEVPMSVSYIYGNKGISVKEVGEATKALCALRQGDKLGVRGPYGKGYEIPPGRVLLVGGGTGMASLMPVADFIADRKKVSILIGARSSAELIFTDRAEKLSEDVWLSTDDGTKGFKGTVVQLARQRMESERYEVVMGCGPERMLAGLLDLCQEVGVPCQLSLERYMKCGAGLCGSCAIDGLRVCADGPVLPGDRLTGSPEFGKCKRDEAGRKVKL